MRLIDADALIKNDEVTEWLSINPIRTGKMLKAFSELFIKKVNEMPTINTIPIPDNATNGDVLKKIFPTAKFYCAERLQTAGMPRRNADFDVDWWNAPYEINREVEE